MRSHLLTETLFPPPWGDERRKQEREKEMRRGFSRKGDTEVRKNQSLKFQGSLLAQVHYRKKGRLRTTDVKLGGNLVSKIANAHTRVHARVHKHTHFFRVCYVKKEYAYKVDVA